LLTVNSAAELVQSLQVDHDALNRRDPRLHGRSLRLASR
jgi:hypothetical protein